MAKDNGSKWRGFSNIPLTSAQKKVAKALKWGPAECFGYLLSLLDDGYKVTLTMDGESGAYTVSATGRVDNAGLTMTQRHSKLETACMAHATAHLQVSETRWPDPLQPMLDLDW